MSYSFNRSIMECYLPLFHEKLLLKGQGIFLLATLLYILCKESPFHAYLVKAKIFF